MKEGWRLGENGSESTIRGRLTREKVDEGSKSERSAPVLEEADGQRTRVYVIGDNPYENRSLNEIEGQEVTARGRWRNGVLRVAGEDLEVHGTETPEAPDKAGSD